MPDRIVRAAINESEKVDKLDWPEEVFYRRMINAVDDFGRFDARPTIIKARIFPLRADRVREADISRWLVACQTAGLIALYESEGKPYLELLNLGDRRRAKTSKYPSPDDATCRQMSADVGTRRQAAASATYSDSDSDSDSDSQADSDAGERVGDALDAEIRSFMAGPSLPVWNKRDHSECRKLVEGVGWEKTREYVAKAIKTQASFPYGYALGCWRKQSNAAHGAAPKKRERSAVAVREDR